MCKCHTGKITLTLHTNDDKLSMYQKQVDVLQSKIQALDKDIHCRTSVRYRDLYIRPLALYPTSKYYMQ